MRSGAIHVHLEALDAVGATLAVGDGDGTLRAESLSEMTVAMTAFETARDMLALDDLRIGADGAPPDQARPDGALPDGAAADFALPDGATPDSAMPDFATPDFAVVPDLAIAPDLVVVPDMSCGKVGQPCCPNQVCNDNSVCLAGKTTRCVAFAGAYEREPQNVCPDNTNGCYETNAFDGCGCPGKFSMLPLQAFDLHSDCNKKAHFIKSGMAMCAAQNVVPNADWQGWYVNDDPVSGGLGCRAKNPYTGSCSCPGDVDTVEDVKLRINVPSSTMTAIGAHLHVCLAVNAPRVTIAGAYELDDDACPDQTKFPRCHHTSSSAAGCTCPPGSVATAVARSASECTGGKNGSGFTDNEVATTLYFCVVK